MDVKMRLTILFLLSLTMSSLSYSQSNSSKRLNLFKDAVEAIGAAGDAIENITDSVAHLIKTGSDGYDYVAANREYSRLRDLSARSTNLVNLQNAVVVQSIDEYLAKDNPTDLEWYSLIEGIQLVINDVKVLLDDVKEERSDFVLESAYSKMGSSLQTRTLVLNKISSLPKPEPQYELDKPRKLNDEYNRLIVSLEKAIRQLNVYIKQSKSTKEKMR